MPFAHFTLATRDVSATKTFFEATFRWPMAPHHDNIPTNLEAAWLEVAPGQEAHLLRVQDFEPSPFEREYGRHIALLHPKQDLEALKKRLVENGAKLIAPLRETVVERFFFQDPNGYVFEVIAQ